MRVRPVFALAFACSAAHAGEAASPQVKFDATMLRNARDVDVSVFETGHPVHAGEQDVDVWRNGALLGRRRVRFAGADAQPCFETNFVAWLGVGIARLSTPRRESLAHESCAGIATLHPAASARYEPGEFALHISIPQALLARRDAAVDTTVLETGIPAFRLSYGATVLRTEARGASPFHQGSLRLDTGMNAGAWRLRHRSTHLWRPARPRESDTLSAHLERDVSRFDARLTLGDFNATGLLLDPIALRGVRFQSDDRMLPASHLRNAPTIRGVADTNARVQVRQAGRLLFDTTVPPGPFALEDVIPLGRGGDLDVRIVEADGSVRSFLVPYAAMPGLLRVGHKRFGLVAGVLRNADAWDAPVVAGALEAGVHDRITARAAAQATAGHTQVLGGIAFASRVGALSLDRLHARTSRDTGLARGAGTRAAFMTQAMARTTLQVSAQHTPASFHALQHVLRPHGPHRERQRFDATLHQTFGHRRHGLRLALVDRRFHAIRGKQRSAQLGWSMPTGRNGASLHASIEQTHRIAQRATHDAVLSLTVPLRIGSATSFANTHARAGSGRFDLQSGISGVFDDRNAWNLGFAHAGEARGSTTTTSASLAHAGRAGHVDAGLSVSPVMRQASINAEGGLLAHAHGVTFGPRLGDTIALVRAEHGGGAHVLQAPNVRLDRRGHALVPQLSPYRRNRVGIEVRGASTDVAFDWTERDVVPRAGAIIDVPLASAYRPMHFVRIVRGDGRSPPMGARIVDASGTTRGLVGRDGVARVPADGDAWFLDGHPSPCTIATESADTIPVATCPASPG
ncbi:fimbria/pilus outer membrane usher protein [Noviluteimonas gilva]|nr:fimbria/pilus outer membrane usher protein [Lysobacter gilvus]